MYSWTAGRRSLIRSALGAPLELPRPTETGPGHPAKDVVASCTPAWQQHWQHVLQVRHLELGRLTEMECSSSQSKLQEPADPCKNEACWGRRTSSPRNSIYPCATSCTAMCMAFEYVLEQACRQELRVPQPTDLYTTVRRKLWSQPALLKENLRNR